MLDRLLIAAAKLLIRLRYRVRIRGLDAVLRRGREGILLLPNHPALIDPVILTTWLAGPLRPVVLADRGQMDRPVIGRLGRRFHVRTMPDVGEIGPAASAEVQAVVDRALDELRQGGNLLLYPSGHLYRTRQEDLRGNSAAHRAAREVPGARVVLIRTRGLWGSRFSWARGREPDVGKVLKDGAVALLTSGVFFAPKREVTIDLVEPDDLPRDADRDTFNRYLEAFYNEDTPPAVALPMSVWDRSGPRDLEDPDWSRVARDARDVPPGTRRIVFDKLRELTGRDRFDETDDLARDLELDSLSRAELAAWIESEFGFSGPGARALETVGDVLLAGAGQTVGAVPDSTPSPGAKWRRGVTGRGRCALAPGRTLAEVFLASARRDPGRALAADAVSGVKTFRDVITGIYALLPGVRELPGERLGVMLPASVAAMVGYLTTVFAGKTPVMVNWTTGRRFMEHSLDSVGVERVLTSRRLVDNLRSRGVDFGDLAERMVFLEDLAGRLGRLDKIKAALRARGSWRELRDAAIAETAVVLFTSGSETLPKAVGLTHANVLANLRDIAATVELRDDDVLLGMLPPFHSFGLTVGIAAAVGFALRVAYHPDPTDAAMLGQIVESFGATVLVGTPTFVAGIARSSTRGQLDSVRLAVTGAESCPPGTYRLLSERCSGATVLEGYGITECSPVVAVNDPSDPRPGTIGKVLPSVEWTIVDAETRQPVEKGVRGELLLRGPSVFGGYLGEQGGSPFVEHDGRLWYRTGDLVTADADGVLTFRGRLKRFIKLGGEMISLPAIEEAISAGEEESPSAEDQAEGPGFAVVEAGSDQAPEVTMVTTGSLTRDEANARIRRAGLSPLHYVRRVVRVEEIPLLGTGKTDYRTLGRRVGKGLA